MHYLYLQLYKTGHFRNLLFDLIGTDFFCQTQVAKTAKTALHEKVCNIMDIKLMFLQPFYCNAIFLSIEYALQRLATAGLVMMY